MNKGTLTGADGGFSLAGLTAGDMSVKIVAAGFVTLTQALTLTADRRFDAALQSAVRTISGVVTDGSTGGVLPNVLIAVLEGENGGLSTRTDATGSYTMAGLSPEPLMLSVSSTSYVTIIRTVTAGNPRQDFVLPSMCIRAPLQFPISSTGLPAPARRSLSPAFRDRRW